MVQNLERKVAEQFWNGQCQWAHVQQLKENKIWQSVKVRNIKEGLQMEERAWDGYAGALFFMQE